ncbi:hypothetical protein BJ165DRAFT_1535246 [Panaeolus papilionaceus]|nr:hypothetical protein BJ165DRAFT_1535246 [Panaeolus papilionaceus]
MDVAFSQPNIFSQILVDYEPHCDLVMSPLTSWAIHLTIKDFIPLLLVSKTWKALCEENSSLWTACRISPVLGSPNDAAEARLSLCLKFSKHRDLALDIDLTHASERQIQQILSHLNDASTRIKTLQIAVSKATVVQPLTRSLFTNLETFIFRCPEYIKKPVYLSPVYTTLPTDNAPTNFVFKHAQSLKHLSSTSTSLSVSVSLMSMVTHIHFDNINISLLISILQHAPLLEYTSANLVLVKSKFTMRPGDRHALDETETLVALAWHGDNYLASRIQRIHLPHLLVMHLSNDYILPFLDLPNLHSLYLGQSRSALCQFFEHSSPTSLTWFSIPASSTRETEWLPAITRMAAVHTLRVYARVVDLDVFVEDWLGLQAHRSPIHVLLSQISTLEIVVSLSAYPDIAFCPSHGNQAFWNHLASLYHTHHPSFKCYITGAISMPIVTHSWQYIAKSVHFGGIWLNGERIH